MDQERALRDIRIERDVSEIECDRDEDELSEENARIKTLKNPLESNKDELMCFVRSWTEVYAKDTALQRSSDATFSRHETLKAMYNGDRLFAASSVARSANVEGKLSQFREQLPSKSATLD